jgi:PHP family Zn ribbon phosphoesterase
MTMDERAEMPTCNLTGTMHNKWLQQFGNKMTCLYEATLDDLIHAFMHITNYISWLRGGSITKGPNLTSLKTADGAKIQKYW